MNKTVFKVEFIWYFDKKNHKRKSKNIYFIYLLLYFFSDSTNKLLAHSIRLIVSVNR